MSSPFTASSTGEEVAAVLKDSIKGKNVLVIGATVKSLGGEFVRVIAPYAKNIWVAGRSKERLQTAVDEAVKDLPSGSSRPAFHLVELDMTSFESVRAAAATINAQELPIDVLLQGVMVTKSPEISRSVNGHELQFAGNHLGTFLLVSLLLPRLRQAGPGARVVCVSSGAQAFAKIRWDDPDYKLRPEEYTPHEAYWWSKLSNVLFVKELAKRGAKDGILAYSLHPGSIFTNGAMNAPKDYLRKYGILNEDGSWNTDKFTKTIPQGVSTYVAAAFDPSIKEQSGSYLEDSVVHNENINPVVTDDATARFWTLTEELVGVNMY